MPLFHVYQHHKSIFSIRELRHLKNLEAKRCNWYILQLFWHVCFQSLLWTDFSTWFSNRSNHEGDHVVSACKLLLIVWVNLKIQHVVIPEKTTLLLLVPSCFSLLVVFLNSTICCLCTQEDCTAAATAFSLLFQRHPLATSFFQTRGCEKSSCFVFSKKWHGRTRQAGLW